MASPDIITIKFRELFLVKFMHSGYGIPKKKLLSDSLLVVPDSGTTALFRNYNLVHRFFNDSLLCFIRANNTNPVVPFIRFLDDVRIRFLLFASADFLAKTNVLNTGAKQVYRFTNQENVGTNMFLTKSDEIVNNADLESADLVKPGKKCFGVIDIHTNVSDTLAAYRLFATLTDQQILKPIYKLQFVSRI